MIIQHTAYTNFYLHPCPLPFQSRVQRQGSVGSVYILPLVLQRSSSRTSDVNQSQLDTSSLSILTFPCIRVPFLSRVESNGKDLLVASTFSLSSRNAVAADRGRPKKHLWAAYARLYARVGATWWNSPGHGDWSTFLERYSLCRDGIYHKV